MIEEEYDKIVQHALCSGLELYKGASRPWIGKFLVSADACAGYITHTFRPNHAGAVAARNYREKYARLSHDCDAVITFSVWSGLKEQLDKAFLAELVSLYENDYEKLVKRRKEKPEGMFAFKPHSPKETDNGKR